MVTGIADPSVLEQYIQSHYRLVEKMIYSDHHHFSTKEISAIYQKLLSIDEMIGGTERDNPRSAIITTEKDAVKLALLNKTNIYALKLKASINIEELLQ